MAARVRERTVAPGQGVCFRERITGVGSERNSSSLVYGRKIPKNDTKPIRDFNRYVKNPSLIRSIVTTPVQKVCEMKRHTLTTLLQISFCKLRLRVKALKRQNNLYKGQNNSVRDSLNHLPAIVRVRHRRLQ